MQTKMI